MLQNKNKMIIQDDDPGQNKTRNKLNGNEIC